MKFGIRLMKGRLGENCRFVEVHCMTMVSIRLFVFFTGANTSSLLRSALDCSLPSPTRPRKSLSSLVPFQGRMLSQRENMSSSSLTLRACGIVSVRTVTLKNGMLVEGVGMNALWAIKYVWFAH